MHWLAIGTTAFQFCNQTKICHPGSVAQWRDLQFSSPWRVPFGSLPDRAAVDRSHRLSGLTGKCLLELREVQHHSDCAKLFRRMAIRLYPQPQVLRAVVLAPVLSVSNKELLRRG